MMGDKLTDYEEQQSLLEEGYDSEYQSGVQNKELEMIKKMLENEYKYEDISSITGKSIEEIKRIEENLK